MGLISYWSSQGTLPIDRPDIASLLLNFQHRFAHVLTFGLMGLLGSWAFEGWPTSESKGRSATASGARAPGRILSHEPASRPTAMLAQDWLLAVGRTSAAAWLAVLVTSLFAIVDEFHQSFVPGRRAAIDDWALDTLSAALAIYVFARLRTSRYQALVRSLAPVAVGVAFVVGVALAARPALSMAFGELGLRASGN
jgi:hypothetical protein